MASVFDAADFFIQLANQSEDDQITNLKLNKLLYYAQGVCLARTGAPLFPNPVEAWTFGPVVPDIYHKYKVCGKRPIEAYAPFQRERFTEEELAVLLDVMRELGQYTGSTLVAFTHRPDTPWSKAIAKKQAVLELEAMRQYFQAHPVSSLAERIKLPIVEKAPAQWYDPAEDEEWGQYL